MNNYKLIIQYDGTEYCGWQIQNNAPTVQQVITDKIEVITGRKVNLIGSGRTDSGVHALGQAASFKIEDEIDIYKFKYSLNAVLPFDISILEMNKIDEEFNARFSAKRRSYVYLFSNFKSPFYQKYSYYYHEALDCDYLNKICKTFLGKKNFTSFARKNTETVNKVCNVYDARWKATNGLKIFYIEADRFLHGMVRTIAGTLLRASKERADGKYIEDILSAQDRESAGEAVPAKGLFLYKVKY
ncbi:MAG: tRNA pseudouridine(38-40) synthase TruA [Ignavibacteriaceae bacterium]|nr:tRNA pseudouridine(38-40) synthase TruA [Ignavibacteriaceae bacterium]